MRAFLALHVRMGGLQMHAQRRLVDEGLFAFVAFEEFFVRLKGAIGRESVGHFAARGRRSTGTYMYSHV